MLTMSPWADMATVFWEICSVLDVTLVVSWTMDSVIGRSCVASIVATNDATHVPSQVGRVQLAHWVGVILRDEKMTLNICKKVNWESKEYAWNQSECTEKQVMEVRLELNENH